MNTGSYKLCPQCKTPAALTAAQCARCGRQYRTQFAPPPNQTIVMPPVAPMPAAAPPYVPAPHRSGSRDGLIASVVLVFGLILFGFFFLLSRISAYPIEGCWVNELDSFDRRVICFQNGEGYQEDKYRNYASADTMVRRSIPQDHTDKHRFKWHTAGNLLYIEWLDRWTAADGLNDRPDMEKWTFILTEDKRLLELQPSPSVDPSPYHKM